MGRRDDPNTYRVGDVKLIRADGFWVAQFPQDGKRKRARLVPVLPEEAKAKKPSVRARQALDQFADGRRAVVHVSTSYTFGQLWELWLAERAKDGKNNSVYNANWKSLGKVFASRSPFTTTSDDYRDYARDRFALGRAPDTVHTELIRLRQCCQWAFDHNMIPHPPKVWLPQAGNKRDRVLTPVEAQALIAGASAGDPHVYLFVVLAFSTGGRHTAILDLEWKRIDFDRRTIDLEIDIPPNPMSKAWKKGRAEVVMGRLAYEALTTAKAGRRTAHVVEHGGKRLLTVRDGFRNACERAGLGWYVEHPTTGEKVFKTDVTPHTIRHTVASWADDGNVDLKSIAQTLGHADERTTRMIYIHAKAEKTGAAVALIDERLSGEITSEVRLPSPNGQRTKRFRSKIDRNAPVLDVQPSEPEDGAND